MARQDQGITIDRYLGNLAHVWGCPEQRLKEYWDDLQRDGDFLGEINQAIRDVPEFAGAHFTHVNDLRVYRCMLYLFVRAIRPEVMVETGVHNGMSSAFILLGMARNGTGTLVSVDMPPDDVRILEQGTNPLPGAKVPGWIIPERLRDRHQLLLGPAERLLPEALAAQGGIDAFLHDSDHSYSHMMFEMGLAWAYLRPGGWILADNVEQNPAFSHFCSGVGGEGLVIASFDTPERLWQHGLLAKTEMTS